MKLIKYKVKPSTAKQGVVWNMVANICNAAHSVLMLACVSRFCGNESAGAFSLSYSISQMMYYIGCFEMANVLITDYNKTIGFRETMVFRVLTNVFMLLSAAAFASFQGFSGLTLVSFTVLIIHMLLMSVTELCESHLHRSNYLNISGKSMSLNLILCDITFATVLFLTRNLPAAIGAMCCVTLLWIIGYDIPFVCAAKVHQVVSEKPVATVRLLLKLCLPLVCMRLIMSYIMNAPKLAIDSNLTLVDQSYFGYMLMPASCVNLLGVFALRPQLVNLANAYTSKDRSRFTRIVLALLGWDTLVTVCVLVGGYFLGIPILSAFYGVDLKGLEVLLCIVLLGGCFYAFATLFDAVSTTMRCHQWNLLVYIPTFLLASFLSKYFVQSFGLVGAALSYMLMMLLLAVGSGLILLMFIRKKFMNEKK